MDKEVRPSTELHDMGRALAKPVPNSLVPVSEEHAQAQAHEGSPNLRVMPRNEPGRIDVPLVSRKQ